MAKSGSFSSMADKKGCKSWWGKIYNYQWVVEAFGDNVPGCRDVILESPVFTFEFTGQAKWQLQIDGKKYGRKYLTYVRVNLKCLDIIEREVSFRYKVHFEKETRCEEGEFQFYTHKDHGKGKINYEVDLIRKEEDKYPKTFTICCDFNVLHTTSVGDDIIKPTDYKSLMRSLYKNQLAADTVIQVDLRRFPCHKFMLAMRSPVFRTMLFTDMTEKRENAIKMEDTSPEVVKKFLDFLYLDEFDEEFKVDLLYMADKYDIPELKKRCASALKRNITKETVFLYLNMAREHDSLLLQQKCVDFIKEYF